MRGIARILSLIAVVIALSAVGWWVLTMEGEQSAADRLDAVKEPNAAQWAKRAPEELCKRAVYQAAKSGGVPSWVNVKVEHWGDAGSAVTGSVTLRDPDKTDAFLSFRCVVSANGQVATSLWPNSEEPPPQ
jgi:hypothetical protein